MKDREPTDARQKMTNGQQEHKPGLRPSAADRQLENGQSETFPVIEEKLKVGKELVETGKVKLHKTVTEEDVNIKLSLEHDEVEVERVAVNQFVEEAPATRYEGDTMIIPVLREEIVKRLVVVEEVRITRRKSHEQVQENTTLRKEEIEVERSKSTPSSTPPPSQP